MISLRRIADDDAGRDYEHHDDDPHNRGKWDEGADALSRRDDVNECSSCSASITLAMGTDHGGPRSGPQRGAIQTVRTTSVRSTGSVFVLSMAIKSFVFMACVPSQSRQPVP